MAIFNISRRQRKSTYNSISDPGNKDKLGASAIVINGNSADNTEENLVVGEGVDELGKSSGSFGNKSGLVLSASEREENPVRLRGENERKY